MAKCTREINDELYRDEWQWKEGDLTVTRTVQWSAPGCHNGCGVLDYTDAEGNLVKIEGDPKSPMFNGRLCMRCLAVPEAVDHHSRIYHPLKRVGERGENKWEKITWDEAYGIIKDYVDNEIDAKGYGHETIVVMHGTGRNATWQATALANMAFHSPNSPHGFLSGDACYVPRNKVMGMMVGDNMVMDCAQVIEGGYDDPRYTVPEVCVVWGNNPIVTNADGFVGHWVVDLMKRGMKLIVIDPRLNWLAAQAEYWVRLRPGTDGALALGWMNVIINEDLYDHDFVANWCYGFEQLAARANEYPPARVAEICGVPEELILKTARRFATAKPATVQWGLKLDQMKDGMGAIQGVVALSAITGNIDVPGGNIITNTGYIQAYARKAMLTEVDHVEKRYGKETYPLRKIDVEVTPSGDVILEALETGKPYPPRMMIMQSNNSIVNMGCDSKRIWRAMQNCPFTVIMDVYMTPTAVECGDLFLPVAMSTERVGVRSWYNPLRTINQVQQTNAKSDEQLIIDLTRVFHPEDAKWKDGAEFWEDVMSRLDQMEVPDDFSYAKLQKDMYYWEHIDYKKYETGKCRPDGQLGFRTPTGRIELYCLTLANCGHEPLPYYAEPNPSPVSDPEYCKEYPIHLMTGRRSWEFFHSEHRQLKSMREFHPWPRVEITPELAAKYGIREGDWVKIENQRGAVYEQAVFNASMYPNSIMAEHGWWFPERDPKAENGSFECFESNINVLTPMCDCGVTGECAPYNTQMCKISKAEGYDPDLFPITKEYADEGWGVPGKTPVIEDYFLTPEDNDPMRVPVV